MTTEQEKTLMLFCEALCWCTTIVGALVGIPQLVLVVYRMLSGHEHGGCWGISRYVTS